MCGHQTLQGFGHALVCVGTKPFRGLVWCERNNPFRGLFLGQQQQKRRLAFSRVCVGQTLQGFGVCAYVWAKPFRGLVCVCDTFIARARAR